MPANPALEPIAPTEQEVPDIQRIAVQFSRPKRVEKGRGFRIVGPEGGEVKLPETLVKLFAFIVSHLARGEALTVVPYQKMLSTQEAAGILGVSRPFLVQQLLDAGKLNFSWVGNRRRIRFEDLIRFKKDWDQNRLATADELVELSQDMGLYE
ncbi:MAG: helix-turn-helix domain-containing protein [Cyanobacteria bacterium NC_groundwater_1444_Ag_S-0.65um_54_12]|nr:helix-turn-helix domain-containing protein [Cyanobacteria bacterium NC_groundwater_1444_Ag_S-0.65um_54_12]